MKRDFPVILCGMLRMCRDRGVMISGVWMILSLGALAAGPPFEPEVTPADSRLLQAAIAVSQTNALAAVEMLETGARRSAAIAFAAGNLYFQLEKYDAAQRAYEEALEQLPRFRAARANLGRIYLLRDLPQDAIRLYRELVADGQADGDIYLLLGHALQMTGHPVSAETAFRSALLLLPGKMEALIGLAQVLLEQQRFQEALGLTGEVLSQDPGNRDVWRLRANVLLLLEQYPQAAQTIEVAKRMGVADAELLALQGDLHINAGKHADALKAYQEAFSKAEPSSDRVLRAIEAFLLLDAAEDAKVLLGTVDASGWSDSERATWLRVHAQLAWQQRDAGQATAKAREALVLNPLDGRALLLLAAISEAGELWEEAILYCERAARIPAYEVEAWIQQAQIEVARSRYARAISLLENAQIRRPQPHVARYLEQLRRMQM
jgi:tetratricopeptide (TPR) repeat protein